jgi:hypothetical protein
LFGIDLDGGIRRSLWMEFHISRKIREQLDLDDLLFSYTGNVILANLTATRKLAQGLDLVRGAKDDPEKASRAGALFAMGLIDELSHAVVARFRRERDPAVLSEALRWFRQQVSAPELDRLIDSFCEQFPAVAVFRGEMTTRQWLESSTDGIPNREAAFEEMMLLWLANSNPSFERFKALFDDGGLREQTAYSGVTTGLSDYFATRPPVAPGMGHLIQVLQAPMLASPESLTGQLEFIREKWAPYLGVDLRRILLAIDALREEELAVWLRFHPPGPDRHRHGAPGFGGEGFQGDEYLGFEGEYEVGPDGVRRRRYGHGYQSPLHEYEAFSADQAWMPTVVLMAKNTYVWLEQLSKKYQRHIHRLDQIPDEELHLLARRGMTGLWLIGLWERSVASRTIKHLRGQAHAVASAYSLKDYAIAEDLGGEAAYANLRDRAARAGLRLASDMVPNHMGIDSPWVIDHPEWFLSRWDNPFPSYSFNGPDLSTDTRVEIKIEDHYYDQSDAAVVFRLRHHNNGATRFVYHGNDGTMFAWNDTAQLDYSKADVREQVMQVILNVARRFPIIRFDAAMVLAKRHVQRLWFPLPGAGGSIPSRAEYAMSQEEFDAVMPREFWREVVDRVAAEVPGTLLLAEAFWLLEGYFVRTLGMHRVYNSAFMNMLRDEENAKYRSYLKKTVEFDPDILKRYVNFMSNPDERTAIDQFGTGDKFFGCAVLLATLPGLPMFGHGQIEGFTERYGMEFKQAMLNEDPNEWLVARHESLIAPLLWNRRLFAESTNFVLYDFWTGSGTVDENVFAYSNRYNDERALIFYNNRYESTRGTIHMSVGFLNKANGAQQQRSLAEGLGLPGDGSLVLAYRDVVSGLEYLRRVDTFRNEGLTVDLSGYQHVVLLNWREMRSTEIEPWDQLCYEMAGSGVPDVNQALLRLRLRPVMEALRRAINRESVHAFAEMAEAAYAPTPVRSTPRASASATGDKGGQESRMQMQERKEESGTSAFAGTTTGNGVESAAAKPAPRVDRFIAHAHAFASLAMGLAQKQHGGAEEKYSGQPTPVTRLASASARLASLDAAIPESVCSAAKSILPLGSNADWPARRWAPLLAWIVCQQFGSPAQAISVFDEAHLRTVFADTFSALGLEGELAWRAAAQVRILLRLALEPSVAEAIRSAEFWHEGDARWLAGYNVSAGTEYFNKEQFEELICWLQLPDLMEAAEGQTARSGQINRVTAQLKELAEAAHDAGYRVQLFLEAIAGQVTANPAASPRKG